jgi:hypothetical protein
MQLSSVAEFIAKIQDCLEQEVLRKTYDACFPSNVSVWMLSLERQFGNSGPGKAFTADYRRAQNPCWMGRQCIGMQ